MTKGNESNADDKLIFVVRNPKTGELENIDIEGRNGQPVDGCSSAAEIDQALDIFLRKVAASAAARVSTRDDDAQERLRKGRLH